jgi:hypothetical protein
MVSNAAHISPRAALWLYALAAALLGYALIATAVALLAVLLPRAGLARDESLLLATMLGFIAYAALLSALSVAQRRGRALLGLLLLTAPLALVALWLAPRP